MSDPSYSVASAISDPISLMRNPSEATLREIANWQLAPSEEKLFRVELPKLQRGFVWEPSKVADLWDSILRGFPIGSMMVSAIDPEPSENATPENRHWLLDGQQRATAIAIGLYNPWGADTKSALSMWRVKCIPILWLDIGRDRAESDAKMFFPYLVTRSHPWGYDEDGKVIPWSSRLKARDAFGMDVDYSSADLSQCFPWEANLPVPSSLLLEIVEREGVESPEDFWDALGRSAESFPPAWKGRFGERMKGERPKCLDKLFHCLHRVRTYLVHLNVLSSDAAENDTYNADDNSLLFVRLNTGGVVLSGDELIFSLFKSAFPLAKDAVEECAAGFMAPSKLFGLIVRLAAAVKDPGKLARPYLLRDFKKEIRPADSPLKEALKDLIEKKQADGRCAVASMMDWARSFLCGAKESESKELSPPFCLPQAVATRTINASPEIFLALLYWKKNGGEVEIGSEQHRRLLGRFTALSWFLPGKATQKQTALHEWISAAKQDTVGHLWSGECLRVLFTRSERALPRFPQPDDLRSILLRSVVEAETNSYEKLPDYAPAQFWEAYAFLPSAPEDTPEIIKQRREANFMSFLNQLWPCRTMLLYAQRAYITRRFACFGQWELALEDTNCPWDWDHIYPSATGLHRVDPIYKEWHNTIGNLRAEGLSENRRDGSNMPTDKLAMESEPGRPAWQNSAITEKIWEEMKDTGYQPNAIKRNHQLAPKICAIVLKRMASIYGVWHEQLRIGAMMDEIRGHTSDAEQREVHVALSD